MTDWRVQLFELNYDERERRAVEEVLESGWITMGPKTVAFEEAFAASLGEGSCTAVSSGTAALHLALLALEVGPGDEVLVPALTFVADANVVRMVGADPVPVDCESREIWNLDPEDVRRKVTPRTRAVICVHYAGYPCRMDALVPFCRRHGLHLIEDAAHAPGARFGRRPVGTIGDVGAFSFFTNKNLSVGEGGMVVARDPAVHDRVRLLRSHGMTTATWDRHEGRALTYDVRRPGLNYRIDEMRAALGLVQLEKLPDANEERARLVQRYRARLADLSEVSVPFTGYDPGSNAYHIFPVLVADGIDRDGVIVGLRDRGVQSSIHYPALIGFSAYRRLNRWHLPVADEIARRELTLPLYPTMGAESVDLVCDALRSVLAELPVSVVRERSGSPPGDVA